MAAKLEQERLQARKARLIKQNEMHRRNLQAEVENLRGAAEWMERGYDFYKAAGRLGIWSAPLVSSRRKKRNSFAKLFHGCVLGFRVLKNLSKG
jgi:hypothetical protein